jgi:hypothetical protein
MTRFLRRARLGAAASLLLLLGATPAPAGLVKTTVTFDGTANGEDVSLTYKGHPLNVFAGQFRMHLDNQPGHKPGPEFLSFCVDLNHYITSSYKVFVRPTADGLKNGGAISYLYQTYGEKPLDNEHAAALQLAIWDEQVDGGDGLKKGALRFSGAPGLAALVKSYEEAALGHTASGLWLDASANGHGRDRGQSVLMSGSPPKKAAVPEPTSFALLGLGGLALAAWRWRKRAA